MKAEPSSSARLVRLDAELTSFKDKKMAKYIRAVKLPSGDLIAIDNIMAVKRFDTGVGLLDMRNRMVGWVEIQEKADEKFAAVLDIFNELINDRRRANQPDWSFLAEAPLSEAPQAKKKSSVIVTTS